MCAAGDYDESVIEIYGDAKEVQYYNSRLNLKAEDDDNLPLACGWVGKLWWGLGKHNILSHRKTKHSLMTIQYFYNTQIEIIYIFIYINLHGRIDNIWNYPCIPDSCSEHQEDQVKYLDPLGSSLTQVAQK